MKKTAEDIIILYLHTTNDSQMMYGLYENKKPLFAFSNLCPD